MHNKYNVLNCYNIIPHKAVKRQKKNKYIDDITFIFNVNNLRINSF